MCVGVRARVRARLFYVCVGGQSWAALRGSYGPCISACLYLSSAPQEDVGLARRPSRPCHHFHDSSLQLIAHYTLMTHHSVGVRRL